MAKSVDRKHRIVRAAIECYVEQGVGHTRMTDIAARAKVDQPLIRYYFKTIDDLYSAIVTEVLEGLKTRSINAIVKGGDDPERAMTGYIRAPFEWAHSCPGDFSLWMYFYYLASFNPQFKTISTAIREGGRERISVLIYRGLEKNLYRLPEGMSVSQAALNVQGLITGNLFMTFTENKTEWKAFADATVAGVMDMLMLRKKPKK